MKIFTPFVFRGSFLMTFFFVGRSLLIHYFILISSEFQLGEQVEVNLLDNLSSKLTSPSRIRYRVWRVSVGSSLVVASKT